MIVTTCGNGNIYNSFLCNEVFMYIVIIILSAISGALNSILFISQNNYVSENTNLENKSILFGMSWAII